MWLGSTPCHYSFCVRGSFFSQIWVIREYSGRVGLSIRERYFWFGWFLFCFCFGCFCFLLYLAQHQSEGIFCSLYIINAHLTWHTIVESSWQHCYKAHHSGVRRNPRCGAFEQERHRVFWKQGFQDCGMSWEGCWNGVSEENKLSEKNYRVSVPLTESQLMV